MHTVTITAYYVCRAVPEHLYHPAFLPEIHQSLCVHLNRNRKPQYLLHIRFVAWYLQESLYMSEYDMEMSFFYQVSYFMHYRITPCHKWHFKQHDVCSFYCKCVHPLRTADTVKEGHLCSHHDLRYIRILSHNPAHDLIVSILSVLNKSLYPVGIRIEMRRSHHDVHAMLSAHPEHRHRCLYIPASIIYSWQYM